MSRNADPPILFFDGDCGLCQRSVRWVLRWERPAADPQRSIRFAPLSGPTFAATLAALHPEPALRHEAIFRERSTVVFKAGGHLWVRSSAVVRLLRAMGGLWPFAAAALWIIPRPLRDWGYRVVARNRHRFFAPDPAGAACLIPTDSRAARFLE